MLFREAGQFKTDYAADQSVLPLREDRWFVWFALFFVAFFPAFFPGIDNDYIMTAIMLPFMIYSMAAIGLNLLVGYTGLVSLGTAGFMSIGAFASYKIATSFEFLNVVVVFILGGGVAAMIGIAFGLPSLRIKGFYLAVTTLAAHFFIEWLTTSWGWLSNYASSGVIVSPPLVMFGWEINTPVEKHFFTLAILVVFTVFARNLVRGRLGRSWMAIRDMDVAAEVIGIPMLKTKLLAFAISSFYCGMAGALWAFVNLGAVEPQAFDINLAFTILFMVIIGGLGSIPGSFMGALFFVCTPLVLANGPALFGVVLPQHVLTNLEFMVFGGLIIFFLIVEPHGFARLWELTKEKLRLWPFPH